MHGKSPRMWLREKFHFRRLPFDRTRSVVFSGTVPNEGKKRTTKWGNAVTGEGENLPLTRHTRLWNYVVKCQNESLPPKILSPGKLLINRGNLPTVNPHSIQPTGIIFYFDYFKAARVRLALMLRGVSPQIRYLPTSADAVSY